jgi:glycosyltransferase involved in cell wall biosynthesis
MIKSKFKKNQNEDIFITVVMPVYNSQKFLSRAIESVLHQSYRNFELFLIDDGSTDDSGVICDRYEAEDKRVKVIHKKNGGVCSSRNLGIDLATGKYLSFIDNDDEYDVNYLKKMVSNIDAQYDVIKCGRLNIKVDKDGQEIKRTVMTIREDKILTTEVFTKDYYNLKMTEIWGSVWNGLYRVDFLKSKNIKFDEKLKHGNEDLIFNYRVFLEQPLIYVYKDILYTHYYRLKHSTSMTFYEDQVASRIEAIKLEKKLITDTTTEKVCLLTEFEGIRECFKILTQCKDRKVRINMILMIKQELDFSTMDKIWTFREETNYKQLIDLILLKNGLYSIYFLYKDIQHKFGL